MSKATIEQSVVDIAGAVVAPPVLELGTSYTFQALVTNESVTPGGNPCPADFEIGLGVTLGGIELVPYVIQPPITLPPGGVCHQTAKAYIPEEYAGLSGKVVAVVFGPYGKIASASRAFRVGRDLSPEMRYKVETGAIKGIILPFLSPDKVSEGVLTGAEGAGVGPPAPAPPKPKIDYSKSKPAPGLDTTTEPEKPAEFEGEVVVGGRIA